VLSARAATVEPASASWQLSHTMQRIDRTLMSDRIARIRAQPIAAPTLVRALSVPSTVGAFSAGPSGAARSYCTTSGFQRPVQCGAAPQQTLTLSVQTPPSAFSSTTLADAQQHSVMPRVPAPTSLDTAQLVVDWTSHEVLVLRKASLEQFVQDVLRQTAIADRARGAQAHPAEKYRLDWSNLRNFADGLYDDQQFRKLQFMHCLRPPDEMRGQSTTSVGSTGEAFGIPPPVTSSAPTTSSTGAIFGSAPVPVTVARGSTRQGIAARFEVAQQAPSMPDATEVATVLLLDASMTVASGNIGPVSTGTVVVSRAGANALAYATSSSPSGAKAAPGAWAPLPVKSIGPSNENNSSEATTAAKKPKAYSSNKRKRQVQWSCNGAQFHHVSTKSVTGASANITPIANTAPGLLVAPGTNTLSGAITAPAAEVVPGANTAPGAHLAPRANMVPGANLASSTTGGTTQPSPSRTSVARVQALRVEASSEAPAALSPNANASPKESSAEHSAAKDSDK